MDAINGVEVLTSLCLEGNTLGVNAAKAIALALAKHAHFKQALWKDMFTGRMKTEIPDALVKFMLYFFNHVVEVKGFHLT